MAIIGSRAVTVTVNSGLTALKVHSGTLEFSVYTEDVTGDNETQDVLYVGSRQVRLVLECSWATTSASFVWPGEQTNLSLKIGNETVTDDFTIIGTRESWEKRGGNQPERFQVVLSPHTEACSNSTATTGIFGT